MNTFIGYTKKNHVIKLVNYITDGSIDELGINLNEYFKDIVDVKELVTTTIDYIDEDIVEYLEDSNEFDGIYEEFNNETELIESMDSQSYYYLFKNDTWYVSKPNWNKFEELELILDSEY